MLFAQFYVPANLIYYYNLRFVKANQSVFESNYQASVDRQLGGINQSHQNTVNRKKRDRPSGHTVVIASLM